MRTGFLAALGAATMASAALAGCGGGGSKPEASASGAASTTSATSARRDGYSYSYGKSSTSSASANASAASASPTVIEKTVKGLGTVLAAGPKKLTLYLFEADKDGKSACTGSCETTWPPLIASGRPSAGSGVAGSALGTITRPGGAKQVTYHGHPLYYYAVDMNASDASGEGVDSFGARWYVLAPSGKAVIKR